MFARRRSRIAVAARLGLLAAIAIPGPACVGVDDGALLARWGMRPADGSVQLPRAEQMIDELDRILTTTGTIGVKTPDVWGQDRLAKFRSEYEAEMADRLRQGFKADINASVGRAETDATLVRVGTARVPRATRTSGAAPVPEPTPSDDAAQLRAIDQDRAGLAAAPPASGPSSPRSASLEPGVVLDEHSDYLNHLNQLRRINAGDDLADRPGYGLYLIRIPVTLSPGPNSRTGKGAIISVSARPVITRPTVRAALRNVVVNETVSNLTQAIGHRASEARDQPAPLHAGAFSLISSGDTELFYGPAGIDRLREEIDHQLARDLGDEPHHRIARVAEWLRGELEASYQLLDRAATPARPAPATLASAGDPLEEIGEQIARRDFARVARWQPRAGRDARVQVASIPGAAAGDDHGRRRADVVDLLAFALRIQAAGITRRLKDDMVAQDPSLSREALRRISFFEPQISDEALAAFEHYVDAKWPLRVYAIEPVIAQQNVADSYGRRSQTALDLVGSGLVGPARAIAGVTADRRASEDETAVRLNPTMVGFGAGRSTFGWIFYPRIQTRSGRDGRLLTDVALLLNGRLPDPIAGDQSIEPGQRECTALIEMPNFVPKVEFVTVASWFRTGAVGGGQRSDLEKAAVLGRKLAAAEKALDQAMVDGQYRPDEYQIARERLEQLRDMMPTQRLAVRVPSTGDNNDSRIFCSLGLQLRPLLVAWHGRPPEEGTESTLFLEGKNFSVHDTHVIAGGKPARMVLVSRHLLKVTIPCDASPTPSATGLPLLDITVATPNGVSNHLLIRMATPGPSRVPKPPEPACVPGAIEDAAIRKTAHDEPGRKPDRPKP